MGWSNVSQPAGARLGRAEVGQNEPVVEGAIAQRTGVASDARRVEEAEVKEKAAEGTTVGHDLPRAVE